MENQNTKYQIWPTKIQRNVKYKIWLAKIQRNTRYKIWQSKIQNIKYGKAKYKIQNMANQNRTKY